MHLLLLQTFSVILISKVLTGLVYPKTDKSIKKFTLFFIWKSHFYSDNFALLFN